MKRLVVIALAAGLMVAGSRPSEAACGTAAGPCNCSDLPNPIYLQVGDTQLNLMKALGRQLRDNTAKPITLVWVTSGSCANIDLMYHHNPQAGITATMSYAPSQAEAATFTTASTPFTCTPTTTPALFPDIGNSALFNSACTQETPPSKLSLTIGPRQGYVLAMPRGTSETAITAEEAYFLFGFGPTMLQAMSAAIMPWVDEGQLWIRLDSKSTLLAWAANISVPAAKWHGTKLNGSADVVNALLTSANPAAAIGILGSEVYDNLRGSLTVMAFRAFGQYAAYYPDSTATSRDKKNLRDGHYTVWSPTIWMLNTDGTNPVNPDAKYVVDMIAGHPVTPAPTFEPNVTVAGVGLVPDCAMRVQRTFEGGPLSLYTPPTSCTCRYEATVDASSCDTCSATTPCATGICRDGYCEEF
ncbi:MAG: hypothetical protein ABJE66_25775 [Deltaproteobacteria bacterium]